MYAVCTLYKIRFDKIVFCDNKFNPAVKILLRQRYLVFIFTFYQSTCTLHSTQTAVVYFCSL